MHLSLVHSWMNIFKTFLTLKNFSTILTFSTVNLFLQLFLHLCLLPQNRATVKNHHTNNTMMIGMLSNSKAVTWGRTEQHLNLTYDLDLDSVETNHCAKYLGRKTKVVAQRHTVISQLFHTWPIAVPGPLYIGSYSLYSKEGTGRVYGHPTTSSPRCTERNDPVEPSL